MIVANFMGRRQLSHDVWEFSLSVDGPFDYEAGQYIDVFIDGEAKVFTLTSIPSDDNLTFLTKIEDLHSSYKQSLLELKQGDPLHISEAMGDLVLPRKQDTPLLLVAGGLGVASFLPLLRECQRAKLAHPVSMLWALRGEADRLDFGILGEFPFVEHQDFVAPERLSVQDILAHDNNSDIYISGSQAFTDSLVHELRAAGIPDTRLLFDYFTGYADV